MDRDYRYKFYQSGDINIPQIPSPFACLVGAELTNYNIGALIEIGIGNGRDMRLLSRCVDFYLGVDQVINQDLQRHSTDAVRVEECDTTKPDALLKCQNRMGLGQSCRLGIYSRFLLHAISDSEGDRLILGLNKLNSKVQFHEFRVLGDQGLDKVTPEHYRRFINPEEFKHKMRSMGGRISYENIGRGLAKFKQDDALVCRLILERD